MRACGLKVKIRLFAELRERTGAGWLELEVIRGCRVADVVRRILELLPKAFEEVSEPEALLARGYVVLVGTKRASLNDVVPEGEVVAILPPVGGGLQVVRVGLVYSDRNPAPGL